MNWSTLWTGPTKGGQWTQFKGYVTTNNIIIIDMWKINNNYLAKPTRKCVNVRALSSLGLISTALSSPVFVPPHRGMSVGSFS